MKHLTTTSRMALGLASITLSAVLFAGMIGLVPDRDSAVMEGRARLCEATAVSFTLLAARDDFDRIRAGLQAIVDRDPQLLSAAVRREDGDVIARAGNHDPLWNNPQFKDLPGAQMLVPIMLDGEPWGSLEFCFEPLNGTTWWDMVTAPAFCLPIFLTAATGLLFWFYLRRVLRYLDPSKVVPGRVRQALDTLAEGLLLLDKDERIVLANRAFTKTAGIEETSLLGRKASSLDWKSTDTHAVPRDLPWQKVLRGESTHTGTMLSFKPDDDDSRTFIVNAAAICDEKGRSQGALTSFGDVTPLEKKKTELSETLDMLQRSAEEIRRQNTELERLATEDPLTGCWNRRSFFEKFENLWDTAHHHDQQLSCAMVDIDYFKSINDRFGHSVGDDVLKQVAATLRRAARDHDFVCRYGGEEFCVLMLNADTKAARIATERLRQAVASIQMPNLAVTASVGVSSLGLGARSPQELLDQADKCLFAAKQSGRNCVITFDQVPPDFVIDDNKVSRTQPVSDGAADQPVPFHAVIALISALAYRDLATAEHSRRVADLCVLVAEGLMSPSQSYLLETAALLHDIGKIGVPDSILLKAGALSQEEREVMQTHQRIGIELVRASFKSPELNAILEHRLTTPNSANGERVRVPLGARILAIADSYDSMISDSVYRKGRKPEEAFAELRRCAGAQFDAELVERFIACARLRQSVSADTGAVSKEAALSIGMHIEHLVTALDRRDLTSLKDLAGRMHLLANKQGASEIAAQAAELESALASDDSDLLGVLHEADSLLKLCRTTQRAYFDGVTTHSMRPA